MLELSTSRLGSRISFGLRNDGPETRPPRIVKLYFIAACYLTHIRTRQTNQEVATAT